MITIKVNGVQAAIKAIEDYEAQLKAKTAKLLERMTNDGVTIVRAKIVEMGAYATGELLSGVSGYYSPLLNAGFVQVDSDHVAFVEFGTGIVGLAKPHISSEYLAKVSWQYNSGETINPVTGVWYYPTDDGEYRATRGQPSRPFMYETARELEKRFPAIAKEVFR